MTPREAKTILENVSRCFGYPRWLQEQLDASARIHCTTIEEEARQFRDLWFAALEHTDYQAATVVVKQLLRGQIEWTYFGQMPLFIRDRAERMVMDRASSEERLRARAVRKLHEPIDIMAIAQEMGHTDLVTALRLRRECHLSNECFPKRKARGVSKQRMASQLVDVLKKDAEDSAISVPSVAKEIPPVPSPQPRVTHV